MFRFNAATIQCTLMFANGILEFFVSTVVGLCVRFDCFLLLRQVHEMIFWWKLCRFSKCVEA